jgi:hypothetical protein
MVIDFNTRPASGQAAAQRSSADHSKRRANGLGERHRILLEKLCKEWLDPQQKR